MGSSFTNSLTRQRKDRTERQPIKANVGAESSGINQVFKLRDEGGRRQGSIEGGEGKGD